MPPRSSLHIVLVEDEAAIRHLVDRVLTGRGHHVVAGSAVVEAEALLLDFAIAPDLALLDVMLPGTSGVEYAAQLRRRFPGIRVVLMTGWMDDAVVAAAELSAQVLFKPFSPATLIAQVEGTAAGINNGGTSG